MDARVNEPPEDAGEGKWLSYDQISQIRGIGRESAVKLVQREGWRRVRGNDGTARILVPLDWLKPARERSPERSPEASPEPAEVAAWRGRAEAAETARDRAEARADRAEQLAAEERARADRADARADRFEQTLAGERGRADALRDRLEYLTAQLSTAEDAAEGARQQARAAADIIEELRRADAARRARGRLAQLRAAWRGE